jgi:hypothetical protein
MTYLFVVVGKRLVMAGKWLVMAGKQLVSDQYIPIRKWFK